MPPAQCPECGRFLKTSFVQGLAVEAAACPKCETLLTAAHFPDDLGDTRPLSGANEEPAAAADLRDDGADAGSSPLEGWDTPDSQVVDLDRFRGDGQPPPDAAILAGAAGFGAVLGAVFARRRARGALLGAGLGAVAAGVARRVWTMDT